VYYAVNRAFIKAIRPNLPHYDDIVIRRCELGVISHPLTLSDIADDAARDRIHIDPDPLFDAVLKGDSTGVLDCWELLLQEYL
jgi:hypothetical protein